jgi:epoxyqueuosine reductase
MSRESSDVVERPVGRKALLDELRARAQSLGFDAFGVTTADARPDLREKLEAALDRGWQDGMDCNRSSWSG